MNLNTAANLRKKASAKVVKQYLQPKKPIQLKRKAPMKPETPQTQAPSPKAGPGSGKKYKTEIEKLLMDEGAINMIYSVKQTAEDTPETAKKRKTISLTNKTIEIKNNLNVATGKALRKKDAQHLMKTPVSAAMRKKSQDSNRSSVHSPPPSPGIQFRQTAECSRIIRRHSSSSSFSSDNEGGSQSQTAAQHATQTRNGEQGGGAAHAQAQGSSKGHAGRPVRKKGVPIYVSTGNRKTYKGKRKLDSDNDVMIVGGDVFSSNSASGGPKEGGGKGVKLMKTDVKAKGKLLTSADKDKLNTEMAKNFKRCSMRNKPPSAESSETVVIEIADNGKFFCFVSWFVCCFVLNAVFHMFLLFLESFLFEIGANTLNQSLKIYLPGLNRF